MVAVVIGVSADGKITTVGDRLAADVPPEEFEALISLARSGDADVVLRADYSQGGS